MIRLKKDDGSDFPEIKHIPFGEILTEYTDKTKEENEDVLLSSAIEGMFLNSELFSHQRGSSNIGYKKVKKEMLILSTQNLHLGNANVNMKYDHGIVSPAYKVYEIHDCLPQYLAYWVKLDKTKDFFLNATTPGASACRRNVDWNALYLQKIAIPDIEEQQKIIDFLSNIDDVITESEKEVAALEEQKKGALQKIFSQEVRFKADDGSDYPEWKSATFGDVFAMLQNNSFSRDQLSEDLGQIQNIHYGDVLVKFGSIIDCENDALPFINEDISTDKFNDESYIQNGDIIVADTAEDYTAGKVAEVQNVGERKILSGLHTMLCRPQKKFAPCYLGHYLNSEQFHKQIVRLLVGTKVYSINKKVIVDTVLNYPCLEEQKKIADFLSDFDTVIDLAKQELEQWKELKKGLLQQLFE